MTKLDLFKLDKRMDEINETLDLCDDSRDADVIDSLQNEMNSMIEILELSLKKTRVKESKLKVIY